MQDRNDQNEKPYTGTNQGMQGIDKAPGEEPSQGTDQFIAETQKGKNKVDGDPSKESDKPLDRQDISDKAV